MKDIGPVSISGLVVVAQLVGYVTRLAVGEDISGHIGAYRRIGEHQPLGWKLLLHIEILAT